MKYPFLIGLLMLPSLSFAAPLTTEQATSLINVVKSSPETPASAFVPLITEFSLITVLQAESLIGVVQASPTTPANAFVNMLLAFTVDPVFAAIPPIIPVIIEPMPKPVIPEPVKPVVTREPYQATVPTKADVVAATSTEIISTQYNENYKFKNNTNALGITYSTAVVKVWRTYTGEPAKDVSVEVYLEQNLASKSGHWSDKGMLVAGEFPFTLDSTIGDSEETALTVEVPVSMVLGSQEHAIRIEIHPDNTSSSKQSSYRGVLVELR